MVRLSNHTRLMNILIALSKVQEDKIDGKQWENPLKKLDYQLEYIELNIPGLKPDALFTSKVNSHSIIFDCKNRSIKEKQAKGYNNLRQNPKPLTSLTTVQNPGMYYADPIFISYHDTICSFNFVQKLDLPLLHLKEVRDKSGIKMGILQLKCGTLVRGHMYHKLMPILETLELPPKIVRSYLHVLYIDPYQKEDGDECRIFVYRIINEITSLLVKNAINEPPISIEADTILKRIYGEIWGIIDHKHKEDLQKFVRKCLNYFRVSSPYLAKTIQIKEIQKGEFVFEFNLDPTKDIKKLTSEFTASLDNVLKKMCTTAKQQALQGKWV